jgi:hypothetical protein
MVSNRLRKSILYLESGQVEMIRLLSRTSGASITEVARRLIRTALSD